MSEVPDTKALEEWQAHGFDSEPEVEAWMKQGFNIEEAKEWRILLSTYRERGPDFAREGGYYYFGLIGNWRKAGFTPKQALSHALGGRTVEAALKMREREAPRNAKRSRPLRDPWGVPIPERQARQIRAERHQDRWQFLWAYAGFFLAVVVVVLIVKAMYH